MIRVSVNFVYLLIGLLKLCMLGAATEVREYCQFDIFNATCPVNHVVMMTSAQYGRMALGKCLEHNYGHIGCHGNVISEVDKRCSGRKKCSVKVPDETLHQLSLCPSGLSDYFSASYACVPVTPAGQRPCDLQHATLTSEDGGYIASLVSQQSAYGTDACPWRIQARPGQRINLTLWDFNTLTLPAGAKPSSSGGNRVSHNRLSSAEYCRAYAIVREGDGTGKSETLCSSPQRVSLAYESKTNVVEIRLLNKRSDTKDYFLIQYSMIGCPVYTPQPNSWIRYEDDIIVVTCNVTQKSFTVRCHGNRWEGDVMNCTHNIVTPYGPNRRHGSVMHLPIELTVVIISSVAFVVVIVVLVVGLLCMKRRRMRNRRPTGNPLLSDSDKDPYGFTLVSSRCGAPMGSENARSPMKDKLYASAIEMKCPRHRSAVTVDGSSYTNIWETRYPIAINSGSNIESEYGIRLVDNSDKQSYDDSLSGTMSTANTTVGSFGTPVNTGIYGTATSTGTYGVIGGGGSIGTAQCNLSNHTGHLHQHHHHHVHALDPPRIESTKLVKSHSCKKYEEGETPMYLDGVIGNNSLDNSGVGRNLDTGAHSVPPGVLDMDDTHNHTPVT